MYKCKYFTTQELVSPEWYKAKGERAIEWIPQIILKALDDIRELVASPCIINSYSRGLKNCGLRHHLTSVGAKYSRHKQSFAFDLHFTKKDMHYVWNLLYSNAYRFGIGTMEKWQCTNIKKESSSGWIHIELGAILEHGEFPKLVGA